MNLIKIMRPKFQIPSLFSYFVGLFFALQFNRLSNFDPVKFFLGLLIVGPLIAGGSLVINQYFDYYLDKESKKSSPLIESGIKITIALQIGIILILSGPFLAYFIGVHALIATLFAIAVSLAYHIPPLRFKRYPFIDSISNGFVYSFPPVVLGWSVLESPSSIIFILTLPLFLGYTAGHMLLAIPDVEEDGKFGINTTARFLGVRNTVFLSMFIFGVMLAMVPILSYCGLYPFLSIIVILPGGYIITQLFKLAKNIGALEGYFNNVKIAFAILSLLFLFSLVFSLLV